MSVQSEINRITGSRDQSFTALANKGVTVQSGSTIDDLPGYIAALPETIKGSGAPTTSTAGLVGQHYFNTSATASPYEYVCINVSSGTYTWEPIGENEIYVGDTTPTGIAQQLWIDTGSSGTLQNVVCSVNGISPTSGGNVDLIPAVRPTYYIDGTNGSDSNDGSQSRPFATINKALDLIKDYKIQNIHPAIVYIAEGIYDEFLDLRRFPLELNINLQGDVTISGILCVYSTCFINADAGGGHKLTVQYSSNVTYPWGKMLIYVSQGSIFDVKSGSSGSVEFKTADNGVIGIFVARESNFYIQKAVFTNTTNTFAYPISIETTEARIGSIVSSGTNIGRVRESGTLFLGDINGGVSYTGTTVDATSRIIFNGAGTFTSGTDGNWTYQKYSDGTYHSWFSGSINMDAGSSWIGGYFHRSSTAISPPSFSTGITSIFGTSTGSQLFVFAGFSGGYTYWLNASSASQTGQEVTIHVYGTW